MAYPDDGELTLEISDAEISGWRSIRVSRGVERCPSEFDISVTEKFPGSATQVSIEPGQVCRIKIGGDLVLTGYVDRYEPSISAEDHTVRVMGRSACEDIVDSQVPRGYGVINSTNMRAVAEALCAPFGVMVTALAGNGKPIPQLVTNLGETVYSVIERVARYSGMLVYDDTSGNLVLAQVGTETHSSGFTQGLNVLEASVTFAMDQRFTEYHAYKISTDTLIDYPGVPGHDGLDLEVEKDPGMMDLVRPDGKPRVRTMAVISEQPLDGADYAVLRARWEMARRYGRGQVAHVVADSWRDSKGVLWTPNKQVIVDLPALKIEKLSMVIGEVSYLRDDQGTRSELTLMVPDAYQPEPQILNPFDPVITQAITQSLSAGQSDGRRDRDSYSAPAPVRDGRRDQG